MNYGEVSPYRFSGKIETYIVLLVLLAAAYCAYTIVAFPFPSNLLYLFFPIGLLLFFRIDMRWAIGIWFFASAAGNMIEIDLPGLPPMRPSYVGLLLLLAVWLVKSPDGVRRTLSAFLRSSKNRILLVLVGWIGLSMIMARMEGVTKKGIEYQANGWLAVVLPIIFVLIVSHYADGQLLKLMVPAIVALGAATIAVILAAGFMRGVDLSGWQHFNQLESTEIVTWAYAPPMLLSLVFFRYQPWWGKPLLLGGIIMPMVLLPLMFYSGHRSSALYLLGTFGFYFLFTRGKAVIVVLLLALVSLVALGAPGIELWVATQTERQVTWDGVSIGEGSRLNLAEDAIRIIAKHPLWGTGTDFYRLHSSTKLIYPDGSIKPTANPHNSWLQVAADSGIPALLLLIAFCTYTLRDGWRLWRSSLSGLSRGCVLFFMCTLAWTLVDSFYGSGAIVPIFSSADNKETAVLFGSLSGFWLGYGLFLAVENQQYVNGHGAGRVLTQPEGWVPRRGQGSLAASK